MEDDVPVEDLMKLKLIVVGNQGTGKSCILNRFDPSDHLMVSRWWQPDYSRRCSNDHDAGCRPRRTTDAEL